MCCCGKPTMNGVKGYKWQPSDAPGVYPVNPPDIPADHELLFDEPGRCFAKEDWHSHHFRLSRDMLGLWLHVRHGRGDEHCRLGVRPALLQILEAQDSDMRYQLLAVLYRAYCVGLDTGRSNERHRWQLAAIENRIKVRKVRNSPHRHVEIEISASPSPRASA